MKRKMPKVWCDGFLLGFLAAFALKNGNFAVWDELRDEYFAHKRAGASGND